ncbi:non-heme iron oxygenase ferredoxin subunit [Arachnia propionica]|uniref:Non-heme iron oxygenase ferredoxin subunit n=1 Tax=Arachnia propionica TaxID=1750 RepID=A0A3P1X0J7_9ACTN|nr:non-heme iron oxygenase ferredoxin subunit [Arachnia propionica]RRD51497.1 non-heme iron oxygenase ferredoxin subunit [Arachnia propionica]
MTFIAVAEVDELVDDTPLAIDEHELAIVRHEGEYYAIHNLCSHGHVALSEGDVEGGTIECYLHGSRFDLRSGQPLCLPATEPVPVYPVRIADDQILVDLDHPIPNIQES